MIQLPLEPKITEKKGNRVIFEISPLYPGYGMTVGNTLRRVLLSSLEGAAATSIKIKGVDHEFSAVNGVLEDVVEIILNLKKVRFKLFKDEPVTLTLSAKGEKEVNAGDIVFSNSNGISFGLSNSSVVTASYTQSTAPAAISAGTTLQLS